MSQRILLVVILVVLVGAGVGFWRWKSLPPSTTPPEVAPEVVVSPKPTAPTFVSVEEYASQIASIKSGYASSRTTLGASATVRLGQKQQYQQLVDETLSKIMLLSAPKEDREAHQDRIIAFISIQALLKQSNPLVKNIELHETSIDQSW